MPALSFAPALSLLAAFRQISPTQPLRTLLRTTSRRFNPPRLEPFSVSEGPAVSAMLARGEARPTALATVRREARPGHRPTIVLGGFVPDARDQVFLLRGYLSRQGSIYYLDYPKTDFSLSLLTAQLDDLVNAIQAREGTPPVVVAVSFGAGVVLDWLRRNRLAARQAPALAGIVLVSPVCSVSDIIAPGEAKPSTLLGRALQPMLAAPESASEETVARARALFARIFEAGAQNKTALSILLTKGEFHELRDNVKATIAGLSVHGARARVRAMDSMVCPSTYLTPELLPLSDAPTLILYAEKEGAVLSERSPARQALEKHHRAFFRRSECRIARNPRGNPVQHASLVFHVENFLPHFGRFYRSLNKIKKAALV